MLRILLLALLPLGLFAQSPVLYKGDTLFQLQNPATYQSTAERALVVSNRLAKYDWEDSLQAKLTETGDSAVYLIQWKKKLVIRLLPADTIGMGKSLSKLAKAYHAKIKEAVFERPIDWQTLLIEIGLALLVLLGLILVLYLLYRVKKRIQQWLDKPDHRLIRDIMIRNYKAVSKENVHSLASYVLKGLQLLVSLVVVYLALPLLFSIFPWTEKYSKILLGYLLGPLERALLAIWHFMPNLFSIIVIVFITRLILKGIRAFSRQITLGHLEIPGFYHDWAKPTYQIVRLVVYALMFVMIFPYLPGSDSDIFKGVSVFIGVLFSLGSSSAISNMVAGLVLTYMRPYQKGERIKVGDIMGDVVEKNLLVTRIRTIKNEEITIPNSQILNGHTTNYSKLAADGGLILHTTVTIGYDVPWKQVHELLIDAAKRTEGIMSEPSPFILQTSLDDFYVSYQLNAYTDKVQKMAVLYSDLHRHIQDCFQEAGVEIMSPHYRAHRDGPATIPPNAL